MKKEEEGDLVLKLPFTYDTFFKKLSFPPILNTTQFPKKL